MITDIGTVIWKEAKELFAQYRRPAPNSLVTILAIAFLGAIPALQAGEAWLSSPMVLLFSGWVPLVVVSSVVADAIAGERERHTLEPLLASRLSDASILIGKITTTVVYGSLHVLLMLLVGLITANAVPLDNSFSFYSPVIMAGAVSLSIVASALAACAGVLVSIRAPTVRSAQQLLSSASMLVFILVFIAARYSAVDWWRMSTPGDVSSLIVSTTLLLSILDIVLFFIARRRFRRQKLVLC